MHNTLSLLLNKRGIKDSTELTDEEKVQFETWNKILSKDELELSDLSEFCEGSLRVIETQFKDMEISDEKLKRLTIQHGIYASLRDLIVSPQAQREQLENYLTSQLE